MRITEHLYQLCGSCYGTNSSIYALDAGDELIVFDAGFSSKQLEVMERVRKRWHLEDKPITHVFLTHAHLDHVGNARQFQEAGAKLLIGKEEAPVLEKGGLVVLEKLFGLTFERCKPDCAVQEGDSWTFGEAEIEAVALPGHTAGSMGYLIRVDGIKAMVTGDFFSLGLTTPDESEQEIMLAAMIKPSYSEEDYGKSLLKVADMDVDILLPGHLITYEGDVRTILLAAYHKLRTEPQEVMDLTKS